MENNFSTFWGIDISKDWVDIAIDNKVCRVKQTKKDLKAFIRKHYTGSSNVLAILESTGGYERLFSELLDESGLTVHIAHPNRVRNFARASGCSAKTDRLDAMVLQRYGQFIKPDCIRCLPSKMERKLQDFSSRLVQLKIMHHQEYCRMSMAHTNFVIKSHKQKVPRLRSG